MQNDFNLLLNPTVGDEQSAGGPLSHQAQLVLYLYSDSLNADITREEILMALSKAKAGKAVRLDKIPIETITSEQSIDILYTIFNQCFTHSVVPTAW